MNFRVSISSSLCQVFTCVLLCFFFPAEEGKKRQQQPLITSCVKFWVPFLQRFVNSSFVFFCYLAEGKKFQALFAIKQQHHKKERRRRSLNQEQVTTINQWDFLAMEEEDLQHLQVCCNAALPC